MAEKCKECGCACVRCVKNHSNDMHLHAEIENLRQCLMERDSHIVKMETQFFNEAEKFPNGKLASIKEEMLIWQEKYTRLHEAHKRVQKVNQNLEDKLLKIVDKCETEKSAFTKDIATLSHRLADANYTIHRLTQDNEKYKNDVNLAIQLLQCKPSNFVGQKYDSLPSEVQAKVRSYMSQKRRPSDAGPPDVKCITVPISTFPPTAMVYNVSKPSTEKHSDDESDEAKPSFDVVSAAIMAKVLEDREKERIFTKHCVTCTCQKSILTVDAETQTLEALGRARYTAIGKLDSKISKLNDNEVAQGESENNNKKAPLPNFQCISEKVNGNIQAIGKNHLRSESPVDKSRKSIKIGKRSNGTQVSPTTLSWKKQEKRGNVTAVDSKTQKSNDQTRIDMINERISRSEWATSKSQLNLKEESEEGGRNRRSSDIEIDVINERVWKREKCREEDNNKLGNITLIEVLNANRPDVVQPEVATSPSFSSDSAPISSSDPSSSSMEALQSINDKHTRFNASDNNGNVKSSKQNRLMGPRNCLMRVTPGSKNILLDNMGHCQTVLYTSAEGKPNTVLVHTSASLRSGRTNSTSSEDNTTLPQDNSHLQRVAEWIQSAVRMEGSTSEYKLVDTEVDAADRRKSMRIKDVKEKSQQWPATKEDTVAVKSPKQSSSSPVEKQSSKDEEDLIRFDADVVERKEEGLMGNSIKDSISEEFEVEITKDMEEAYLKLAASLDIQVSDSDERETLGAPNMDITIEKYRKDKKRTLNS